jgi:uncharacterized protein YbjT (DUF2867 family)
MRVLVTGATEPFGRAVCRPLPAAGHDVTAMARSRPQTLVDDVDFTAGDVRDSCAVTNAVSGYDAVVRELAPAIGVAGKAQPPRRRMYHRCRIWDPQGVANFAPNGVEGLV